MPIIVLITLSFLGTACILVWLGVFFHWARPWDFKPVGEAEPAPPDPENWPDVRILVPARNESDVLPDTLPALLKQEYPGTFKVVLVDDRSDDGTAETARRIASECGAEDRLTVLTGESLPDGWVGKVWAMEQAARHESESEVPKYFLLTDADIRHAPGSLRRLVSESEAADLALNSRMARLRCESISERLLIPAFVFFFNLLYPMRAVNDPRRREAAAAGGCVLLTTESLRKAGGFACIKGEIIDDVNLARAIKGLGVPIRLSLSDTDVESTRAYETLAAVWKMVRRTAFTELNYSWLRLFGAVVGLTFLFVLPPLWIVTGILLCLTGLSGLFEVSYFWSAMVLGKGLLAWVLMSFVYRSGTTFFRLSPAWSWTLPIAGVLYGAMTVDSAFRHPRGGRAGWR